MQNQEIRQETVAKGKPFDLGERLLEFAVGNVKLTARLARTVAGRYIAGQLMRASASCGANYQEARGAESRADFVHKPQLVLKELREAGYWLQLAGEAQVLPGKELESMRKEADELTRIVVKSVLTAKSKCR